MTLCIVILAAGRGSRMASDKPKVLHTLAGQPMLSHILKTVSELTPNIHIVVGVGAEQVKATYKNCNYHWCLQEEPLGSGHALQVVSPQLSQADQVVVLSGDVPLITLASLKHLIEKTTPGGFGVLTADVDDPTGLGRILRDSTNKFTAIREQKDANKAEQAITEINTGIYCIPKAALSLVQDLDNKNKQGEYLITDLIALALAKNISVEAIPCCGPMYEISGVNTREQLAMLERNYQLAQAKELMQQGVTLYDPARIDIRGVLTVGRDIEIDVDVILEGEVTIDSNVKIGPFCHLKNCHIGSGSVIHSHTTIDGATIDSECQIGPYSRVRPGSRLRQGARVGNFVELKKTELGRNAKASHLSYLGDANIGAEVNIGAGTITCNYDGVNKFKTTIDTGAFIGSNTALVAPVHVGAAATVGAGSVIRRDVSRGALAVSRAKQKEYTDWEKSAK